ncbi:hypothetical protein OU798_07435 [Prolixibacteraceae bacterium Z1-6]|uniref:Uncharacterized protein n=1 Tax=Draconibacterium aestuarii TaxID=2998507 RepID=A0A9X3F418_9BACT|nr:hypothetical protein [Prolixibacteraceae bacterium Z1-6]
MARKALTDQKHELIMAHILDPEHSPLPAEHQKLLERVVSMSKLLDRYPSAKQAVALHKTKFPEISDTTAYRDARLARKVYNSMHEFDYDFWKSWIIEDIVKNIEKCRDSGKDSYQYKRVIAMEHANLLKAIGEKPEDLPDPKRNEKHNFYLMVNVNNENVSIDFNQIKNLPKESLQELNRILFGGNEIDDQGAAEIMES